MAEFKFDILSVFLTFMAEFKFDILSVFITFVTSSNSIFYQYFSLLYPGVQGRAFSGNAMFFYSPFWSF